MSINTLSIKKLLTKIINHIDPKQVGSSGSVTVTAARLYTVCTITLQPNSKYVVLGDMNSSSGVQHVIACFIDVSAGTPLENFGSGMARVVAQAGGGPTSWKYIRTGSTAVTVRLQCYGYLTTSHTESGHLFAWRIGGA